MGAAQGLYAEATGVATTSGTTWVDVCSISAGSFTANKTYLILAHVFLKANTASGSPEARIRLVRGTTPTEFTDAYGAFDRNDPAQETDFGWVYVFTQPGTTELVKLQISASTSGTYTAILGQIFALNLDDIGTDGVEYHWNEFTTDYTTTSSYVAKATKTFTPNGTDKWLAIAHGVATGTDLTTSHKMRLNDSVAGVLAEQITEGEDATNDFKHYLLVSAYTPSNASHTISAEFAHVTTAYTVLSSRIFLLNLSKFAVADYAYAAAEDTPATTPSWTTTRTLSPTPTVTGDWFVIGHYDNDLAATTTNTATRLQINPTGAGLSSNPAYGDTSPAVNGWDATDENPVNIFKMLTMNSGAARQINLDVSAIVGTTQRAQNRCLVAFSLELAAVADTYPAERPLVDQWKNTLIRM